MTGPGMYFLHIIIWLASYFMPGGGIGTWELSIAGNTAMVLEKEYDSFYAKEPGSDDLKDALVVKIKGAKISLIDGKKREKTADMADYLLIDTPLSENTFGQLMCKDDDSDLCVATLSVTADKVEIGFRNGGNVVPLGMQKVSK